MSAIQALHSKIYNSQLAPHNDNDNNNNTMSGYVIYVFVALHSHRFCGLVVGVPGYRSRGPGSVAGATTSEMGVHSASSVQLRSYLEEKVAAPV
jgi:hypothetical protein